MSAYPRTSRFAAPSPTATQRPNDSWARYHPSSPPLPLSPHTPRSQSSDRKRRYIASSPERRDYPRQPVWTGRRISGMSSVGSSSTGRDIAIDNDPPVPRYFQPWPRDQPRMDELPREAARGYERDNSRSYDRGYDRSYDRGYERPSMDGPRRSLSGRRGSDAYLPRWQPDAEVDRCPVCGTDFTFWYRKHHCRKCGRVVCAACSPHRITIPRQYIVQPPSYADGEWLPVSSAVGGQYGGPAGGEIVRVCNPCVPDPWTPGSAVDDPSRQGSDDRGRRERQEDFRRPDMYRPVPPPPQPTMPMAPPPFRLNRGPPPPRRPSQDFSRSMPQGPTPLMWPRESYNPPPPPIPHYSRPAGHRYTQSAGTAAVPPAYPYPVPVAQRPIQAPAPPPSAPPQPSRPRREVREEDECPVCGNELPPGNAIREAHIQECIATRFSSTPTASTSNAPVPTAPPRSSSMPTGAAAAAPPSTENNDNPLPEASRPRATSYRPRGMAVYRATEKDCVTEDGDAQECVICFEEFQPGDEMGRMECLCKFHRACIRSWWETKGSGSCPTHMLNEN